MMLMSEYHDDFRMVCHIRGLCGYQKDMMMTSDEYGDVRMVCYHQSDVLM